MIKISILLLCETPKSQSLSCSFSSSSSASSSPSSSQSPYHLCPHHSLFHWYHEGPTQSGSRLELLSWPGNHHVIFVLIIVFVIAIGIMRAHSEWVQDLESRSKPFSWPAGRRPSPSHASSTSASESSPSSFLSSSSCSLSSTSSLLSLISLSSLNANAIKCHSTQYIIDNHSSGI